MRRVCSPCPLCGKPCTGHLASPGDAYCTHSLPDMDIHEWTATQAGSGSRGRTQGACRCRTTCLHKRYDVRIYCKSIEPRIVHVCGDALVGSRNRPRAHASRVREVQGSSEWTEAFLRDGGVAIESASERGSGARLRRLQLARGKTHHLIIPSSDHLRNRLVCATPA